MCYQPQLSQSRVGDQTRIEHRKLLKGRQCGRLGREGGRREEKLPFFPCNHIFILFKVTHN